MINQIEPILYQFTGRPAYNMAILLAKLSQSTIVPRPDKYYTFIYKAKTPNISYDKHPLITCTSVHSWGFTGYNYHWNDYRQYAWGEVISNVYGLNEQEFSSAMNVNLMEIKRT